MIGAALRTAPLLALLALAGCASPGIEALREPEWGLVELVLEDARPERMDDHEDDVERSLAFLVPLVPACPLGEGFKLHRSFLPEVKRALLRSGRIASVAGPGDDPVARAEAPLALRVVVTESRQSSVGTSYALGFVGVILHALGAPTRYERTTVGVAVELRTRAGEVLGRGEARASEVGVRWIYEDDEHDEREAELAATVEAAVLDALDEVPPLESPPVISRAR